MSGEHVHNENGGAVYSAPPIDLTTFAADIPLPEKGHEIYNHTEPRNILGSEGNEDAKKVLTILQLQAQVRDLQNEVAELREHFTMHIRNHAYERNT